MRMTLFGSSFWELMFPELPGAGAMPGMGRKRGFVQEKSDQLSCWAAWCWVSGQSPHPGPCCFLHSYPVLVLQGCTEVAKGFHWHWLVSMGQERCCPSPR